MDIWPYTWSWAHRYFNVKRGHKQTPVHSPYRGQDDYGGAIFTCRWTGKSVPINGQYRISGNIIPQANVCYIAAVGTEPQEAASRKAFHESEANCNMCRHFNRLPYDKKEFSISGVFYGTCTIGAKEGDFMVAPDDWMGMSCWESR